MSNEQQAIKAFLSEARERASEVLQEEHVSLEAKNVIRDLLQVSDSFLALLQQSDGQSADTRILKKKLDAAKSETRALASKIDSTKKTFVAMIEEIKQINFEAAQIIKRYESAPDDPSSAAAVRIRAATQKMVSSIVQPENGSR